MARVSHASYISPLRAGVSHASCINPPGTRPPYVCYVKLLMARVSHVSVFVYYVAVRTIVLSCHGSNLARPVIIHDIIHSLMCMPSIPHCGFFGVSSDGNCA